MGLIDRVRDMRRERADNPTVPMRERLAEHAG